MPPRPASTNVTWLISEWNQSMSSISTFTSAPILSAPSPYAHHQSSDKEDSFARITGGGYEDATLEFEQILLSFQEDRMLDVYFAMFCIALMIDVTLHGLNGTFNSPWIAFLDSISHCSAWIASPPQEQLPTGMKILGALLSKSASGLVTSTLFGFPAPFSQTFSVLSFMVAMVLCLNVPSLPQHVRATTGPWRLLFVFMSALHKSRKLRSVMRDDRAEGSVFILGILTIELTGWVTIALRAYWSTQSILGAAYLLGVFISTNRLRLIISLCAIYATRWDSMLILPLLALHKSAIPSKDGNYLTWW